MNPAGALELRAEWLCGHIGSISIANGRPRAARMLVGRTPDEARRLAPLLFSLCGHAQGAACEAATAAALGEAEAADAVAERAVAAECAQEHLWRLLLDWPLLFGRAPEREAFAALHRLLRRAEIDPASADEAGQRIEQDVAAALSTDGLLDRLLLAGWRATGPAVPLLPRLDAAQWAEQLGGVPADAFCAYPQIDGQAHETGPLARHANHARVAALLAGGERIAARFLASLFELSDCVRRLCRSGGEPRLIDAASIRPGCGVAIVETARGLLLHAASVKDGTITDYAIVAPTEWNFHPAGAFMREAGDWQASDVEAARRRLAALALSLDPCVGFEIKLMEPSNA
ncbi:MAG: hypothetical protein HGA47_03665 [Zoogloea sp.]|nr:hypothetical protein [Zoogloea sp.]